MRFFKRGPDPAGSVDFWSWWAGAREPIATGIETGGLGAPLIDEISRAVRRIAPAMAWELAPGKSSRHAFCVSPEGNATLRQVAIRWLDSAPPADETWEYHASKQASSTLMVMGVADQRFDLADMRAIASWDPSRQRTDVRLWHPGFTSAPDQVRLQVAFVFLDSLLGEDDVERWIGQVDVLEAPTDGRTPAELRAEVERRKAEEAGDDRWILGQSERPDGTVTFVMADASLKRIDHPFADHHVTIEQRFGADRYPTDEEAAKLNAEEDDFLARLGSAAIYAGRVTEPGRQTMHFVAEDPDGMRPAIDGWAQDLPDSLSPGLPQRRLLIDFERDMDWSFQRALGSR